MNKSAPIEMGEVASPVLEKRLEEFIAKAVPVLLAKFLRPTVVQEGRPRELMREAIQPLLPRVQFQE